MAWNRSDRYKGYFAFIFFFAFAFMCIVYLTFTSFFSAEKMKKEIYLALDKQERFSQVNIGDLEFHLFYNYFFQPGVEWQNLSFVYTDRGNEVSVKMDHAYTSVQWLPILRGQVKLKNIDVTKLDLRYQRVTEEVRRTASLEEAAVAQVLPEGSTPRSSPKVWKPADYKVSQLPEKLQIGEMHLYTELNTSRFFNVQNLILKWDEEKGFSFQTNLDIQTYYPNMEFPIIHLIGESLKGQIHLNGRVREAVLSLSFFQKEKNIFLGEFQAKHLPSNLLLNLLHRLELVSKNASLSSQWVDTQMHFEATLDQILKKDVIVDLDSFASNGDYGKIDAKSFQYQVHEKRFVKPLVLQMSNVSNRFLVDLIRKEPLPFVTEDYGIFSGNVVVESLEDVTLEGRADKIKVLFSRKNIAKAQTVDSIQVKGHYKEGRADFVLSGWKIQNGSLLGKMNLFYNKEDEALRVKFDFSSLRLASDISQHFLQSQWKDASLHGDLSWSKTYSAASLDLKWQDWQVPKDNSLAEILQQNYASSVQDTGDTLLVKNGLANLTLQNQEWSLKNYHGKFWQGKLEDLIR